MGKLIDTKQLGINTNKKIGKIIVNALCKILKINKLNNLFDEIENKNNVKNVCEKILEIKNINTNVKGTQIDQAVKKTGAQIIICNFPHGALDAIIILNEVLKVRNDVKILANELFENIEFLKNYILKINKQRTNNNKENIRNIKNFKKHIEEKKGVVIVFPALNIATYQKGFSKFKDNEWNQKTLKLILKSNAEILPITICGRNSMKYHILRKINHRLGQITLIREFVRKENETIDILIGKTFEQNIINKIKTTKELEILTRANMILMRNIREEGYDNKKNNTNNKEKIKINNTDNKNNKIAQTLKNIIKESAEVEIMNFDEKLKVYENNTVSSFVVEKKTNNELNNLCKENFKNIQNKNHKHCVVVVEKKTDDIITIAEIGYGQKIINKQGVDGFYLYKNFDVSHKLLGMLEKTIEIGQIAIIGKKQKEEEKIEIEIENIIQSVKNIIKNNDKYNKIIMETEICNSESYTARRLVVNRVVEYDYDNHYKKLIHPHNSIGKLMSPILDHQSMRVISKIGAFGHFIKDADNQYVSNGGVMKMINNHNGKVIGINSSMSEGRGVISVLISVPGK